MDLLIKISIILQISLAFGFDGQCSADKIECSRPLPQYETDIINNIQNSLKEFTPCPREPDDECFCHTDLIKKDLAPFQSKGINKWNFKEMLPFGTHYQIVNHSLYREETCLFPSRCSGIEHFLKPIVSDLPDMDIVINCRDWPQIRRGKTQPQVPVLSFSKTDEYIDVMYPAWSFWEGGPAISLHPTGIGRWDKHRQSISMAGKKWPWEKKLTKGFFRGSRTSDERDSLVLLSRRHPDLVDASYTKNQAWKSHKDTLDAEPAQEVTLEDHCQYKYLFNFRGVSASFRLKHLFLCKSLIFHVGDEWQEFYYFAMKPWVHYVPIKSYPSEDDLEKILLFFQEHDDLAVQIAQRGYKFIWDQLRMSTVQCYWRNLLKEYGKLIRYEVKLEKELKKIF